MENNEPRKVYYNQPQLKSMLIDANEEYAVWGRGTGKSSGLLAPRSRRNALELPQSVGLAIGKTYQQLLTQTLPSLVEGWRKLGWERDLHYFVGRRPPKSWKWLEPYQPPLRYENTISIFNGSVIQLVSQDRPGSANGINSDYIFGDEAKYINYQKYLDEVLPTMRANRDAYRKDGVKFSDLPFHHSITFTTSMPTAADAKWILAKREEMDQEKIGLMFAINAEILRLRNQLAGVGAEAHKKIMAAITRYEKQLYSMRFGTLYYSEASSLDNIAVLGEDYIKRMRRIMPDFIFNTEILNRRPDSVEGGFYPLLDMDHHGYDHSFDNSYLDSLEYDFEKLAAAGSRQDADCVPTMPLRLAVDYGGGKISVLSVAQDDPKANEYRFIKSMFVKEAPMIDNLVLAFCKYYRYHKEKVVYFIPDNEYGNSRVPNSDKTFNQDFIAQLRKAGWVVHQVDNGRVPDYQVRYLLWQKLLKEQDPRARRVRFNLNNCKELINSMLMAPIRTGSKGQIEKDKTSERRASVKPEDATHFSDTADLHAIALGKRLIGYDQPFEGNVYA